MHKSLLVEGVLDFSIIPKGPILVKSGVESADPTRPDMEFVRTRHGTLGETVYIPGSSLKGVFRSYAERVIRTIKGDDGCCNPLDRSFCGGKENLRELKKKGNSSMLYKDSCLICKTFGSTLLASHTSFQDAYPIPNRVKETNETEERTGVAIDRVTGGAARGALFNLEAVTKGEFRATLYVKNFELWQLGLIGLTIRDLKHGLVRIGFGKARGLGEVEIKINNLLIRYFGTQFKENGLELLGRNTVLPIIEGNSTSFYGVGKLSVDEPSYGFDSEDSTKMEKSLKPESDTFTVGFQLSEEECMALLKACAEVNLKRRVGV